MRSWALVAASVFVIALAGVVVALAQSPQDSTDTTFCRRTVVPAEGEQVWYYIDDAGVKQNNDGQYYRYEDLPGDAEQIWRSGRSESDSYTHRTGPGEATATPGDGYRVCRSAAAPTATPTPTPAPTATPTPTPTATPTPTPTPTITPTPTPTPIHEVSQ